MDAPLLLTRDPLLLDEVARLAAAAGARPHATDDVAGALRAWSTAPVVLVGVDLAPQLARLGPDRRGQVHVLALDDVGPAGLRTALELGAESVLAVGAAPGRLTEVLTDLGEGRASPGRTIAVVGGSGGAGATTVACALGQVAAAAGTSLVVDLDPLGPGADRVLGLERAAGVRWGSVAETTGRLSSRALREALPRREALGVLGWAAGRAESLDPGAVREVVSAARRGHDTVVVDLPRVLDATTAEVRARSDLVVVVVSATVPGVTAAARLCDRLVAEAGGGGATGEAGGVALVVRGRALTASEVTRATGLPVLAVVPEVRRLREWCDLGLGPVHGRRSPLARPMGEVLGAVPAPLRTRATP